jgi:uncharacterized protein (TIGR00375 family)
MDLENISIAAQHKGIDIVATGDFTHPEWMNEIQQKLVPAESGLYRLKPEIELQLIERIPESCRSPVRFMLVAEISCIYKQAGKVRKGHYLVFMPNIEAAKRFCDRLSQCGNLCSDGRPILGISAVQLLEMVMEQTTMAFVVPAHIWTPWFSIFGSQSGFDSVEECFGDLSNQIFALETGLSSDPLMNRAISGLDRFTLISNSDAHSPEHMGREANVFCGEISFAGIRKALDGTRPQDFWGTIEFFPEEGKYHYDGHKGCNVCCHPNQSHQWNNRCPVCGKSLTIGVLNRCFSLSDRKTDNCQDIPFVYSVPLLEIISQLTGRGVHTKTVQHAYFSLLSKIGPELDILHWKTISEIEENTNSFMAHAIFNMRNRNVHIEPGYDGVYGKIIVTDRFIQG